MAKKWVHWNRAAVELSSHVLIFGLGLGDLVRSGGGGAGGWGKGCVWGVVDFDLLADLFYGCDLVVGHVTVWEGGGGGLSTFEVS